MTLGPYCLHPQPSRQWHCGPKLLLHSSRLQWHGLLRCTLHGHLHCSLLGWHGLLLLLWPWRYLQLLHCSLLQCYCLWLQRGLLLLQCSLLALPLA